MSGTNSHATLTTTEPGSAMHAAFSRYWWPVLLSADLLADRAEPVRVTLMNRDYVAFRDGDGRVGLLDERCCHRSASLCLGRIETDGIRCIYHGWKYDVDGRVIDLPTVKDPRVKEKLRQRSYAVREAGGLIWAYVGAPDSEPPLPAHPFFDLPATNRFAEIVVTSANYTRTIEGVLDSSHVGILHSDVASDAIKNDLSPKIEVADTDYGFCYAALRDTPDGDVHVRVTAFAYPTSVYVNASQKVLLISVPITDDRTHFVMIFWHDELALGVGAERDRLRAFYGIDDVGMDKWGLSRTTHDLPGRPGRANNFLQDRDAMRAGSFSGMHRFIPEDFGVAMSMGPIADQPKQNLVPSDSAIFKMRRLLVDNARRIEAGEEALGLSPVIYPASLTGDVARDEKWTVLLKDSLVEQTPAPPAKATLAAT